MPFASESYIGGQWCRFYMGKSRKMGDYKMIQSGNTEIIRSLFAAPQSNAITLYKGRT